MSSPALKELYQKMLRIRIIEETIAEHYFDQEMRCPVHLSVGQEAVATGVCAALRRDDMVMSGHRSHAHYLAKGGNLNAMIAELYGKSTGCCNGKGGSMHLVDLSVGFLGAVPIVGSTIPIATGTALTSQMKGEDKVTDIFFGDGSTEEGVFHESLNFASLKKLPILFACENNQYSVYAPLHQRQPHNRHIYEQAAAHGLTGKHCDGNNLTEVFQTTSHAVDSIRSGNGPQLIEFSTYRYRTHCGAKYDNDLGYRTEEEYQSWRQRCPVETTRKQLFDSGDITEEENNAWTHAIECEIAAAFETAWAADPPALDSMKEPVFA